MAKSLFISLIIVLANVAPLYLKAQDFTTYNLEFIKAKIIDYNDLKDVLVLFKVTAKNPENFPPVLSMRLAYSLGDSAEERKIDIMKDKGAARIVVYGDDVKDKNYFIYELAKEEIDSATKDNFMLLAFYLIDVTKNDIDKMTFTYGLWEKQNINLRVEKKFEFTVD